MSAITLQQAELIIAGLATAAAVWSALLAWAAERRSHQSAVGAQRATDAANEYAEKASRAATDANRHAERANVIHARVWADQYFEALRAWADEVSNNIARGIHLNDYPDERFQTEGIFAVRAGLSALIDRGRWYFPNRWHEDVGKQREPAYRGVRQPILDHVFAAYSALGDRATLGKAETYDKLVKSQRLFVSEVQRVLDPRRRDAEIGAVLDDFRVAEALRKTAPSTPAAQQTTGADAGSLTAELVRR